MKLTLFVDGKILHVVCQKKLELIAYKIIIGYKTQNSIVFLCMSSEHLKMKVRCNSIHYNIKKNKLEITNKRSIWHIYIENDTILQRKLKDLHPPLTYIFNTIPTKISAGFFFFLFFFLRKLMTWTKTLYGNTKNQDPEIQEILERRGVGGLKVPNFNLL